MAPIPQKIHSWNRMVRHLSTLLWLLGGGTPGLAQLKVSRPGITTSDPCLGVDKYIPQDPASNNTPSLIPAACSKLYKLLTAHPVNSTAEKAVKLHPPSKQHSKVPLLYDMMEAKNSHFPLQVFQIESYPLWQQLPTPFPHLSLKCTFISSGLD